WAGDALEGQDRRECDGAPVDGFAALGAPRRTAEWRLPVRRVKHVSMHSHDVIPYASRLETTMRRALAVLALGCSLAASAPALAQSERFRGLWEGTFH